MSVFFAMRHRKEVDSLMAREQVSRETHLFEIFCLPNLYLHYYSYLYTVDELRWMELKLMLLKRN